MNNQLIFYSSDFAVREKHTEGYAVPFEFLYFSSLPALGVKVCFDGEKYTNCKLNADGSLSVFFNSHRLGIGNLKVLRHYFKTNSDYADGIYDQIFPVQRAVFLDENDKEHTAQIAFRSGWELDEEPEPETPEEDATLSANDIFIDADGGTQIIQLGSSKTGDSFTVVSQPTEDWFSLTDLGNNQYEVSILSTPAFEGRAAEVVFANTQGIKITVPVTQKAAIVSTYGAWMLTMNNSTAYSKDFNAASIELSASAERTDTYNNGQTKKEIGTIVWSSSDKSWAAVSGNKVNITKCSRISSDTRTATITATVASVGGNASASKSFTITQSVMPEIVLSPTSFANISAEGATKTVSIKKYGSGIGSLSASSSNSSVATASISGDTLTITVSSHETSSARSATITVTDASGKAANVTVSISQMKASFMLYYGASAGIPTEIATTSGVTLANNATVKVETTNTDKKKCHWVAAKSAASFSIKSWLDKLETDLNGKGLIKSATIGNYKVFYYLSGGYISGASNITITA